MAQNRKPVSSTDPSGWVGWVYFAAFMMMLAGIFQGIAGLVALFRDQVFLVTTHNLFLLDFTQWGWIHLILGVLLITASLSLFRGNYWGRFMGVVLASLSAIANFAFINAYPFWSLLIIAIDVFIIYALLVHGNEAE